MKKLLSIIFLVLFTTIGTAQVSKTVNVSSSGTLFILTSSYSNTVTNLTITGNIDVRDIKHIRDNMPLLEVLDMSAVSINSYTGNDGTSPSTSSISYPINEMPTYSFYNLNSGTGKNTTLKSIILPSSLLSIGSAAFAYCSSITNLILPVGLNNIESSAFYSCTGLSGNFVIPNNISTIKSNTFHSCIGITSLSLPSGLTSIGNYAFESCSGIKFLTLPTSLNSIGNAAFYQCSSLTNLTILSEIINIGGGAFQFCTSINSLTFPKYTNIGDYAFLSCTGITTLTLPDEFISLGEGAFDSCIGIKTIYSLNATPPTLSNYCFRGLNSVNDVYVPTDVAVNSYKANLGWFGYFPGSIIKKTQTTEKQELLNRNIRIQSEQNKIIIEGIPERETVFLYTVNGKLIQTVKPTTDYLSLIVDKNVVYLLKIGNQTFKVLL